MMTTKWPLVTLLSFIVASPSASAFYVWYDSDGTKQISNLPRHCIRNGRIVCVLTAAPEAATKVQAPAQAEPVAPVDDQPVSLETLRIELQKAVAERENLLMNGEPVSEALNNRIFDLEDTIRMRRIEKRRAATTGRQIAPSRTYLPRN